MMIKLYITIVIGVLFTFSTSAQGVSVNKVVQTNNVLKMTKANLPADNYSVLKMEFSSDRYSEFGGYLKDDEIYFLSDRKEWPIQNRDENKGKFLDLYVSGENGKVKKTKFVRTKINNRLNEGPICFTKDGKRVYYTQNSRYSKKTKGQDGRTHLMLYTARIEDGKWFDIQPLWVNRMDYSVGHPAISRDERTLYYVSNQPGGKGGSDIYMATIDDDGNVSSPKIVQGEVNTSGNELFPFVGLNDELYFSSNGHAGAGGLDVFTAKANGNGFSQVMSVGTPINSAKDDFAYTVYNGGKGFFSSDRDGSDDVFSYTLLTPQKFSPVSKGVVSMNDNTSSEGVKVELLSSNGNVLSEQTVDASGKYSFDLEEGKSYVLQSTKDGYVRKIESISAVENGGSLDRNLEMEVDNGIPLNLFVSDAEGGGAISDVKVEVTLEDESEKFIDQTTKADGVVSKPIRGINVGDEVVFHVKLAKEGYLTKVLDVKHVFTDRTAVAMHDLLKEVFKLEKIDLGKDLGQMIDLNPIYFDAGKFNIRSDAALELDKIVNVMNENPSIQIKLLSHTDSNGASQANLSLSQKRAKASMDYIVANGGNASNISAEGLGETQIMNRCKDGVNCSPEEHQENRRTEFKIVKM